TPLLVVWVMNHVSWRRTFMIFGGLGVLWAIWFYRWFRDNPREHPQMSEAELVLLEGAENNAAGHGDVPGQRFLTSPTVWFLWVQYFCMSYGWYFYITWLPTYLREARHVDLTKGAVLAGLPLFFGGLGSLVAGLLATRAATWLGNTARARRVMAGFGL